MRLPISLPGRKRPDLFLRRVAGGSMRPALRPGRIIVVRTDSRALRSGEVVLLRHAGNEIIKRVYQVDGERLYVLGDNPDLSTDSRTFGWVDRTAVTGIVIWPRTAARGREMPVMIGDS